MNNKVAPTKANLIKAKEALKFAILGQSLLDKKRTVMIQEKSKLEKKSQDIERQISLALTDSYKALQVATITAGSDLIQEVASTVPLEDDYTVIERSIMGVEVPEIKLADEKHRANYSSHRTPSSLDLASKKLIDVRKLIYKLAESSTGIQRLNRDIKKVVSRTNALEEVQIPKYRKLVSEIEAALEEKEREDFFRIKKVKQRKK